MKYLAEEAAARQCLRIAPPLDFVDSRANSFFKLVGEVFQKIRTAERVENSADTRFEINDLLGAKRHNVGVLAWGAEGFVEGGNFECLNAGEDERQSLNGAAYDIVHRLL